MTLNKCKNICLMPTLCVGWRNRVEITRILPASKTGSGKNLDPRTEITASGAKLFKCRHCFYSPQFVFFRYKCQYIWIIIISVLQLWSINTKKEKCSILEFFKIQILIRLKKRDPQPWGSHISDVYCNINKCQDI